ARVCRPLSPLVEALQDDFDKSIGGRCVATSKPPDMQAALLQGGLLVAGFHVDETSAPDDLATKVFGSQLAILPMPDRGNDRIGARQFVPREKTHTKFVHRFFGGRSRI